MNAGCVPGPVVGRFGVPVQLRPAPRSMSASGTSVPFVPPTGSPPGYCSAGFQAPSKSASSRMSGDAGQPFTSAVSRSLTAYIHRR